MFRCSSCGGLLYADVRRTTLYSDHKAPTKVYSCGARKRGKRCNALTWVPIDIAHRDLVEALPKAFSAERLATLEARLGGPSDLDRIVGLRDQAAAALAKAEAVIERLLDRLEAGSDPDVNRRLDARQAERDRLRVELEALDAAVKVQQAQDPKAVVARIKALGEAWVDLLESDRSGEARQLLAGIFPSGLAVFKTESKTEIDWHYEGDVITTVS